MCEWQFWVDERSAPVRERSWHFSIIYGNLHPIISSTNTSILPDRRQRYSDKYMKHIFFSILTALAICQCKEPAPGPKNILNCYVRFDAAAKKVKAEAIYHDGVTKKIIEMPGGFRFQSTEMKLLPVRGITYMTEFPAKFSAEQIFDWKNKKGEKSQFSLNLPEIDSFYFSEKTLSVQVPAQLHWLGKPLGKGETIVFIWEDKEHEKTVPMEVSTTLGAPLIEIPAAKLAEVGPGDWILYLVRKRKEKTEIEDCFVESTAEYYTKPAKIKVVK